MVDIPEIWSLVNILQMKKEKLKYLNKKYKKAYREKEKEKKEKKKETKKATVRSVPIGSDNKIKLS